MYEYEKKQIKSALGDMYALLQDTGCILAGGAVTSLFTKREVNDYDIYFTDPRALGRVLAEVAGYSDMAYLDQYAAIVNFTTERSILCTLKDTEAKVQFIHYKIHDDVQSIFNSFDFTTNMGAFDFAKEEFVLHQDFLVDNARRQLTFNDKTDFPIVSLLRTSKYKDRGYTISKAQMLRVAFTIARKDYDNWDTVLSEVGGLYGVAPKDLFDTTKEFSLDSVIDQLSQVTVKDSFGFSQEFKFHTIVETMRRSLSEEFLLWYDTAKEEEQQAKDKGFGRFYGLETRLEKNKFVWEEEQSVDLPQAIRGMIQVETQTKENNANDTISEDEQW